MRKSALLLSFVLFCLMLANVTLAEAKKCSVNVGDVVEFEGAPDAFETLSKVAPVKDEFETTQVFEKRRAQATKALKEDGPLLLEATYDPEKVVYDADRQRFIMSVYAWDNMGWSWEKAIGYGNAFGIETDPLNNRQIGLIKTQENTGTYEAENGYGVKVVVNRIEAKQYGVFDKKLEYRAEEWAIDLKHSFATQWGKSEFSSIQIPVPIEEARDFKDNLRIGVAVRPRYPFVLTGNNRYSPSIDIPRETLIKVHVIVADILCAVVANKKGRVLKIVNTND